MRARISIGVAVALLFSLVGTAKADGGLCGPRECPLPTPGADRYVYDAATRSFVGGAPSREIVGRGGKKVEVFYAPACPGNTVDGAGNVGDRMCPRAVVLCQATGGVMMFVFERLLGDPAPPAQVREVCMDPPVSIPLAVVQASFVRQLREADLPHPSIASAPPAARSLVNLPLVFWTQDAAEVTLDVTVPLPARLTALPSYRWSFGDGATGPDDPGLPFDPGVLPTDNPDYYPVAHTFSTAGGASVTVVVTWHATFVVAGIDETFDIPAIELDASLPVTLFQSRTELVAGSR